MQKSYRRQEGHFLGTGGNRDFKKRRGKNFLEIGEVLER